ncbi:MAG: hypothetical protein H6690_03295, partial [Erysipelotrichaceae bacterium]|nr:hypothetical protein [Erysipelotrichaceae bacterium]
MKKIIYLLVILLLIPIIISAQWEVKNSGTDNFLSGVHFVTENIAYVNGDHGLVYKTMDGGESWTELNTGHDEYLRSIFFVSEQVGWVVGLNGLILKTINGGSSWQVQTSTSTEYLRSVFFIDANNGWIAGYNGVILNTANGGSTWNTQNSSTTKHLKSICFLDASIGYAVGFEGTIIKTTNGGTSWSPQISGITTALNSVSFASSEIGWAVGSFGVILYTNNGGANWTKQISGTENSFSSISLINNITAYSVGSAGIVMKTSNGGTTWSIEISNTTNGLYGISVSNENNVIACGENGTIIKYILPFIKITFPTGGETFTEGETIPITWESENVDSVMITFQYNGMVNEHQNIIVEKSFPSIGKYDLDISQLMYAEGTINITDVNSIKTISSVYLTINKLKGERNPDDWIENFETTLNLSKVHFISLDIGFLVGDGGYRTSNGGKTWEYNDNLAGQDIFFLNDKKGWIVGNNVGVKKTEDAGISWTNISQINGK